MPARHPYRASGLVQADLCGAPDYVESATRVTPRRRDWAEITPHIFWDGRPAAASPKAYPAS